MKNPLVIAAYLRAPGIDLQPGSRSEARDALPLAICASNTASAFSFAAWSPWKKER